MKSKSNNSGDTQRYKCAKCKAVRWFPKGLKVPPPCGCGGRWVPKMWG